MLALGDWFGVLSLTAGRAGASVTGPPWEIRYQRDGETGVRILGCGGEKAVKNGPGTRATVIVPAPRSRAPGVRKSRCVGVATLAVIPWLLITGLFILYVAEVSGMG